MALIGTIRKNGWILIVTMVLALGGFILMDVMSNSQRYSAADINNLGKINDQEIKRIDFETYEKLIYSKADASSAYVVRSKVWDYFVEEAIVTQEAKEIGIGVPKEELIELQFGTNLSPIMAERFKGDDGQPNRATLASIKAAIEGGEFTDPTNRQYWAVQEKEIVKKRLEDKIIAMASKGLYTPSWQAEMAFRENNERLDFRFVMIPYDRVKDGEAPVGDADYKAYLDNNPHLYDQPEESRIIAFAEFNVVPTSADSALARTAVAALVDGLREAKSDSAFVLANNGTMDEEFKTKVGLSPVLADTLLRLPIGTVIGPVLDVNEWKIAKIVARKVIPDSVKARHILIRETKNPASEKTIDSLMALINSGKARFDSLAVKNSQDPGSAVKGGDLGWFPPGAMVPEFNDVCFNKGEQGKLYKVATQFGWHLIEITGKQFIKNESGVKAVYISRRIEPSKMTQQAAKDKAVAVLQKAKNINDLTTMGGEQGFVVQNSTGLLANDYSIAAIPSASGEDARNMIRWAFEKKTKEGSVSPEIFVFRDPQGGFFDSKYIVAALKTIVPKGPANIASLKNLPEADTKVKNLKKGEFIKSKIQTEDFSAIATQWNARMDTVKAVSFLQSQSGEPRIQGALFALETGKVSKPIIGNQGVYLISPITAKTQTQIPTDLTMFRKQVSSSAIVGIRTNLIKALIKNADKQDNRATFF
jgi:peptidyl-prolyl cis-trans isomerase D